jgi:PST family polysaccharide transporter
MLRFGAGMSLTGAVMYGARNVDSLIVGRALGPFALGLYSRAHQLVMLPIMRSSGALNAVLFPAYARIQDEPERLRRVLHENVAFISLIVFPTLTCLAVTADEVVAVVLGRKWEPAIQPFRILCMAGLFICMSDIGEVVVRAKGVVLERLKRHLVNALVIGTCTLIGSKWDITGAATGIALAAVVQYLLMAQLVIRLVEGTWRSYFRAHAAGAIVALAIGTLTLLVAGGLRHVDLSAQLRLATCFLAALSAYALAVAAFARRLLPLTVYQLLTKARFIKMPKEQGDDTYAYLWRFMPSKRLGPPIERNRPAA